jgi:putative hydrolase of the HAD superfamily
LTAGHFADLDAVTLDAYGTLVTLADPVAALREALSGRGVELDETAVRTAFRTEAAHYRRRSHEGRDAESLERLRVECAGVFLEAAGAELEPGEFSPAFQAALRFEPLPGALEAVRQLGRRGLATAVVSNWDVSLHEALPALGLRLDEIVTSAEAGSRKPDPAVLRLALERLGVAPKRALHVGDTDEDEALAAAAGTRFAWVPLVGALQGWAP